MLDEMFSPQIGNLLRRSGIDCVCVVEDKLLRSQDDETLLAAALEQDRVLVTNNIIDFEPLRRRRIALGQRVPQLIYTDDTTFPRNRNYVGQVTAAFADAADSQLFGAHGGVLWLVPSRAL